MTTYYLIERKGKDYCNYELSPLDDPELIRRAAITSIDGLLGIEIPEGTFGELIRTKNKLIDKVKEPFFSKEFSEGKTSVEKFKDYVEKLG